MTGKRANNMLEIKAFIKGRSQLSIKPLDIHCEVCNIFGEDQMSYRMICRWVAKFRTRQQQLQDTAHTGHPATTTTKSNIEKICNTLQKDSRFTARQLAQLTNLSLVQAHAILKKYLQLRKINAGWIPHLLTDEQMRACVANAKKKKTSRKCIQNIAKRLLTI